jgi:hypothetical protein
MRYGIPILATDPNHEERPARGAPGVLGAMGRSVVLLGEATDRADILARGLLDPGDGAAAAARATRVDLRDDGGRRGRGARGPSAKEAKGEHDGAEQRSGGRQRAMRRRSHGEPPMDAVSA